MHFVHDAVWPLSRQEKHLGVVAGIPFGWLPTRLNKLRAAQNCNLSVQAFGRPSFTMFQQVMREVNGGSSNIATCQCKPARKLREIFPLLLSWQTAHLYTSQGFTTSRQTISAPTVHIIDPFIKARSAWTCQPIKSSPDCLRKASQPKRLRGCGPVSQLPTQHVSITKKEVATKMWAFIPQNNLPSCASNPHLLLISSAAPDFCEVKPPKER